MIKVKLTPWYKCVYYFLHKIDDKESNTEKQLSHGKLAVTLTRFGKTFPNLQIFKVFNFIS